MTRCWRLDDGYQTLVLGCEKDRLPEVVYWGGALPAEEDLAELSAAWRFDVSGGMLDANPDLSICPEASRTFPGEVGLKLRALDGKPITPDFRFRDAIGHEGGLALICADDANGLIYTASFRVNRATRVIEARAKLEAETPVHLQWLAAPVFPAPQSADEMIDFSGRWCGEFIPQKTAWAAGLRARDNHTGRTGHEHFPGLIVPCRGATNCVGDVYAFHYGWSGGHRMVAEELADGRRQIQFGHASDLERDPGTSFETATLYASYSRTGLNGCGVAFQRHLRDEVIRMPDAARPRPVHYNCWEAVYFDHKLDELKAIAERAADLGAERFVLDDGWFGKRDGDTSALADWVVDERKYPDGLTTLIHHVHGLGMRFGIWFEPEMINPDSDTYRAHPDWALGDRDQLLGRNQMALNMALPEVRNYLYDRIAAVLGDNDIDYIKWDHNRVLPVADAAQTRGTYALLDRLRADFSKVEIESCASGGGRIDFGILQRTHRVWLSDSNDALERLRIQHDAALFLPMTVTGSHVGPRVCHTSGRVLDIRFRAWVAAQRHMGFEMDPRELTDDEAAVLKDVTAWWKTNRDWMAGSDILRLDSADPAVIAEQQMSRDGERFVLFAGKMATSTQIAPRPLRLTGLDPNVRYKVELINRGDAVALSRGNPALKQGPVEVSGAYLMGHGLTLPWSFPEQMWVMEGQRI